MVDIDKSKLDFYVDGAASTKPPRCGGWACIVVQEGESLYTESGCEPNTTNNRMEMTSFLTALQKIKKYNTVNARIFSDSAYVVNCFRDKWYEKWMLNNWRASDKQPVKNVDLWREMLDLYFDLISNDVKIEIIKVQSHKDDKFNNYADLLAVKERKKLECKLAEGEN